MDKKSKNENSFENRQQTANVAGVTLKTSVIFLCNSKTMAPNPGCKCYMLKVKIMFFGILIYPHT